jgi:ATP-dependent DNA ligase
VAWTPARSAGLRPAGFVEPCIPTLADKPPAGIAWIHEIKHDGYRLMVWRDGERVRLFTRRGYDWTKRYPRIVNSARKLRSTRFLIDGEAVIVGNDGLADFDKLHSGAHNAEALLYAFDLLSLDGADIRDQRLEDRRASLRLMLIHPESIRFSDSMEGDGELIFRRACSMRLEGIVSKRRDAPYESGRTKTWLKVKNPDSPAARRLVDPTR